jgi:hypothetical protein
VFAVDGSAEKQTRSSPSGTHPQAGYRAKSGSCRVKGQDVILIDRDARLSDQIEFLASELAEREDNTPLAPSES